MNQIDNRFIQALEKCKNSWNIIKNSLHGEMFLTKSYAFLSSKRPTISQNGKNVPPKSNIFFQIAKFPWNQIPKFRIFPQHAKVTVGFSPSLADVLAYFFSKASFCRYLCYLYKI